MQSCPLSSAFSVSLLLLHVTFVHCFFLNDKNQDFVYSLLFLETENKMYPKVKVRTQNHEEDDEIFSPLPDEKGARLFVNLTHSPIQCHFSPEKENQAETPPCIARVGKPLGSTKPVPASSGNLKNKIPTNKSCSVTRPRAVLSSPDNDCMIGKRNKLSSERCMDLKCKLETKMVAESKVLKSWSKPESPLRVGKALKVASTNTTPVKKKGTSNTNVSAKASNLTPTY